ncbi:MAG: hypothetical protein M5U12_07435 [Verrucomicrobia bacterium]|nr:hypothetical protein [Verrucomicrobiota bacterium]
MVIAAPDLDGRMYGKDTASVAVQDVRERLQGGLVPFKIRTSDGAESPVPHREFVFLTSKRVVVATGEGFVNVLDPLHIVSIEEAKPLPA